MCTIFALTWSNRWRSRFTLKYWNDLSKKKMLLQAYFNWSVLLKKWKHSLYVKAKKIAPYLVNDFLLVISLCWGGNLSEQRLRRCLRLFCQAALTHVNVCICVSIFWCWFNPLPISFKIKCFQIIKAPLISLPLPTTSVTVIEFFSIKSTAVQIRSPFTYDAKRLSFSDRLL